MRPQSTAHYTRVATEMISKVVRRLRNTDAMRVWDLNQPLQAVAASSRALDLKQPTGARNARSPHAPGLPLLLQGTATRPRDQFDLARPPAQRYPSPAAEPNADGSTTVCFSSVQPAGVTVATRSTRRPARAIAPACARTIRSKRSSTVDHHREFSGFMVNDHLGRGPSLKL